VRRLVELKAIGYVKSEFTEPADHMVMREKESSIVIDPVYGDGLYRIEEKQYLMVIFYFDRAEGYSLQGTRRDGEFTGVFASRSPRRPNAIGVTTVRLLERKGNELRVLGLDALNGTPVLDLKPYAPVFDEKGENQSKRFGAISS
jgi:tRNA-Thr(GGU) m(6)t(6)A37 methyltransferase TsaA